MAASVVDLPEPVGPVTTTRPLCNMQNFFNTTFNRPTELADEEKPALLRAYLKKWKWEVGAFFDGVGADAPESELQRIAPDHPVFRITG